MISLDDIKDYLNLTDTGLDGVLTSLEAGAVEFVQTYTGRYFGPVADVTFHVDGGAGRRLWIPDPLTAQPTEVSERRGIGATFEQLQADEFEYTVGERSIYRVTLDWPTAIRSVRVVGQRGYAADSEPPDIRSVVLEVVGLAFKNRPRELSIDVAQFIAGGFRLPAHVVAVLDRYRRLA